MRQQHHVFFLSCSTETAEEHGEEKNSELSGRAKLFLLIVNLLRLLVFYRISDFILSLSNVSV